MTAASTNWARTFFTFWTGQALSLFGTQLVQFALVWWLTETTGSATVLATARSSAFCRTSFSRRSPASSWIAGAGGRS